MKSILVLFFSAALLISCSSNTENKSATPRDKSQEQLAKTEEGRVNIPPAILERGEEVYRKHCLACHQADGTGNPGMYPPLNETKMVNGDKEELIKIILEGMSGEIEVKGEIYNQVMVPHNFLSDREIADLLSYVRTSFGNTSDPVSEEEVATVRAQSN